jgi:hypothetical protein
MAALVQFRVMARIAEAKDTGSMAEANNDPWG